MKSLKSKRTVKNIHKHKKGVYGAMAQVIRETGYGFIVERAMGIIKQAMIDDSPELEGSYAHSWHCNIAMAIFDECAEEFGDEAAIRIGNAAATRFMKLCFDVNTKP